MTVLFFFQNCVIISLCGLESIPSQKGYGIIFNLFSKAAEGKQDICQNMSVDFDHTYFTLRKVHLSYLQFIRVANRGWTSLAELLQQVHMKYLKSHPNMKMCKILNCGLQLFLQHKFLNLLSEIASPLCVHCHASLLPLLLYFLVDLVFVSISQDMVIALTF